MCILYGLRPIRSMLSLFHSSKVQGGDPTGTGRGGESYWGTPFRDEYDLKGAEKHSERGMLSMANKGFGTNGYVIRCIGFETFTDNCLTICRSSFNDNPRTSNIKIQIPILYNIPRNTTLGWETHRIRQASGRRGCFSSYRARPRTGQNRSSIKTYNDHGGRHVRYPN